MAVEATTKQNMRGRMVWAVVWMCGSILSFSAMAVAGREASRVVDAMQISVWRALIGLAILIMIIKARGIALADLNSHRPGLQFVRNVIHFSAQLAWLYALTRMPLAELTALEFTAPLWVALLAPFLIGERLTALRLGAIVLGFIGVLVVVRPGAVPLSAGAPFGLIAAIGYALSMLSTKSLLRGDSAFTILFWMQSLQIPIGLAAIGGAHLAGSGQGIVLPDLATFGWFVALGVLGLTAHYSLTKAFTFADATIVAPLDFLRLPVMVLVGFMLYAEPLDLWVLGGGLIVVVANFLNIRGGQQRTVER